MRLRNKTKSISVADDPVVAEVRAIRQAIWKKAGGTFEGLQRFLAQEKAKHAVKKNRRKSTKTKRP